MTRIAFPALSESDIRRLAQDIAFALRPGDIVALEGDLGAGKTTLARWLIRALAARDDIEIPSPTFTLVQSYDTARFEVAHFDLYRLANADELSELGLDQVLRGGIAIVEWPERAGDALPPERWALRLEDTGDEATRHVTLAATGAVAPRLERLAAIRDFLIGSGWGAIATRLSYLQGDASPRRYARLQKADGATALLMDSPRQADGPPVRDGKPYSQIAHLAEDVRAFVAIAGALKAGGFSTPEILAHDLERGLLVIEDFGDTVFGQEIAAGADQEQLWRSATDVLVGLRDIPTPHVMALPDGTRHKLPALDAEALRIETELLLDWYWPTLFGAEVPNDIRSAFRSSWQPVFDRILAQPNGLLLRDYHSPNLIRLAGRTPPRDVGLIDFQDALAGPAAYDLVSLLQDARLDVPAALEKSMLDHYVTRAGSADWTFDAEEFQFAYAALGAQRNTKILGIFARLARRDGKRQYLAHVPRIWGYLARDLAHDELRSLRAWYDRCIPVDARTRALTP